MNATQIFIGLIGLFVVLLVIALLKSKTQKPPSIHTLKDELAKHLPHHSLTLKDGTPARIIVSLNDTQQAIIVIDKPKALYVMGDLPIFTTNKRTQIKHIAHQIANHKSPA